MAQSNSRVVICPHTATVHPTTPLDIATDPAANNAAAQYLPYMSAQFNEAAGSYGAQNLSPDLMVANVQSGVARTPGTFQAGLKCSAYQLLMEGAFRNTFSASAIALDETDLTSVAASASGFTFTFGGGAPVTEGLRIGDIIVFSGLSEAANNGVQYLITGFSGTSNRVVAVYPAPTDMTADTSFNVTTVGRSITNGSAMVNTMYVVEQVHTDYDTSDITSEVRISGMDVQCSVGSYVTVSFSAMGRKKQTLTGANSPFFTAVTAAPDTKEVTLTSSFGMIMVNGVRYGSVTDLKINMACAVDAVDVMGSLYVPEISVGMISLTGTISVVFDSTAALTQLFAARSTFSILVRMVSEDSDTAETMVFYIPAAKFTGDNKTQQGTSSLVVEYPFMAYKATAGNGTEAVMLRVVDSEIV